MYVLPEVPIYFDGQTSMLSYRQMMDSTHKHDITIEFRSEQSNGLLMYAQGPKGVRDYVMIAIENNRVIARFVMIGYLFHIFLFFFHFNLVGCLLIKVTLKNVL